MNGNYSASSQMQNPGLHPSMEPELLRARRFMAEKIYEFFMWQQQQIHGIPQKTMLKIVKKLEEGLFKIASTKEEYVNLATLESRIRALVKRPPLIIPTPGMPQSANSSLMATSSVDHEPVMDSRDESLHSQAPEQIQFADMQNHFSQMSVQNHARGNQLLSLPSGLPNSSSSRTQTSEQMQQILHENHFVAGSQSDLSRLSMELKQMQLGRVSFTPIHKMDLSYP